MRQKLLHNARIPSLWSFQPDGLTVGQRNEGYVVRVEPTRVFCSRCARGQKRAFTLVEMLVVMAVIVVMIALVGPTMTALKGANDVSKAVYDIAGILEQARAYAIGNHTYVWVGIGEFDVSKDSSTTPQTPGTGRVAIAVAASKDGTQDYDDLNTALLTPPWTDNKGTTLSAVAPVYLFDDLHLAAHYADLPTTGSMTRLPPPTPSGVESYTLGNPAVDSCVSQFAWPLGQELASHTAKYKFQRVINFDPTGVARIQYSANTDEVQTNMEIGLQRTHGTIVDTASKNVAVIQINCITGNPRIYRP